MALANYSDLKSAVASWSHRDDLTAQIPDFIALAEADLQVRAKLTHWDTSASITVTSGSGPLPSDFAHAISVQWSGQAAMLRHLPEEQFDGYLAANATGTPVAFIIRGTNLLVAPALDGTATMAYTARFAPLSDSATTNSLLTLFPDAYLHGALMQLSVWIQDDVALQKYAGLFETAVNRVRKFMIDHKYPNGLQMRVV